MSVGRVMVVSGAYGIPPRRLWECRSQDDQIAWTVAALLAGRRLYPDLLWLGGVEAPMRVIAAARAVLRREGILLQREARDVVDAAGEPFATLNYFIQ